jgi:hypothetical protein
MPIQKPRFKTQGYLSVIGKAGLIFVLFLFLAADAAICQYEEYDLKAVYLERITRFVEWPDETEGSGSDDSFVIGVLGENPFGTILTDLYAERTIKSKNVKVRYLSQLKEIEGCDLLFISQSMSEELPQVLQITANKPILTVGDTKGFAEKGVLVNFFIEKNKLRFEINEQALHEADILIDSLLLKVSKIINPLEQRL